MRKYRYIWLSLLLFLYGMTFAIFFGPDFINSGRTIYLIVAVLADLLICILLFFALRKKSKYQNK